MARRRTSDMLTRGRESWEEGGRGEGNGGDAYRSCSLLPSRRFRKGTTNNATADSCRVCSSAHHALRGAAPQEHAARLSQCAHLSAWKLPVAHLKGQCPVSSGGVGGSVDETVRGCIKSE